MLSPRRGSFLLAGCELLLPIQERSLARQSPAIAAQATVAAHYSMAGNDDGNRIGGTSAGHCAACGRLAHGFGNFGVGTRAAIGDGPQLFPYATLKGGGLHVDR